MRIGKHFGFLKLERNQSRRIRGTGQYSLPQGYLKPGYDRGSFDSSGRRRTRSPQGRSSHKYPIGSSLDGALSRSIRKSIEEDIGMSGLDKSRDVTVGKFYVPQQEPKFSSASP